MAPPRVGGSPTPVRKPAPAAPPVAPTETQAAKTQGPKDEFKAGDVKARKPKYDVESLSSKPSDALTAWKHLNKSQRARVLEGMEKRYGKTFTEQFEAAAKDPKLRNFNAWANGPGVGPSEKWLRDNGYKPYAPELPHRRSIMNEVWVHPSGKEIYQVYESKSPEAAKTNDIQEHWKGIVDDSADSVGQMKTWYDDLASKNVNDPDYAQSYTDFWLNLKDEHDTVQGLLADNPDMPAATRTALEGQLKEIESLNEQRRSQLPMQIESRDGSTTVVMPDWLYFNKD